jgi:hypothetical protein
MWIRSFVTSRDPDRIRFGADRRRGYRREGSLSAHTFRRAARVDRAAELSQSTMETPFCERFAKAICYARFARSAEERDALFLLPPRRSQTPDVWVPCLRRGSAREGGAL